MADNIKCSADNLGATISAALAGFTDAVIDGTKAAVKATAAECCEGIKADSPVRKKGGGKYKRGWKVQTAETPLSVTCTVHNSTDYQLTHLLENGHAKRNGGRVEAIVHIKPNEEKANAAVEKRIREVIENA